MDLEVAKKYILKILETLEDLDTNLSLAHYPLPEQPLCVSIHTWSILEKLRGRLNLALRLDDARVYCELGYAIGALQSTESATLREIVREANYYINFAGAQDHAEDFDR